HLRRNTDVLSTIADSGKLEKETEDALSAEVDTFREGFITFDGHSLMHGDDGADVEIEQEQIVRQKKA
ncbi:MAG: F0F1 ATP synthase subunit alpha, partial [Cellulomonas sp.]|nr:F0F1 ATP synthase subunit alpha [Cellulomonas sp.]